MPDANAQTLILERDIKSVGDRITENVHRLDRHLEIYSQNGKELAALKSAVLSLEKTLDNKFEKMELEHAGFVKADKDADERIRGVETSVTQLAMKIGLYASLGSAAATAVVLFMVDKILNV